jgi:8-oxo-dGTP pyrophosphatase MutT (NUDIX family)
LKHRVQKALFGWFRKSVSQVGVLPVVVVEDGILIALITSRRRGRWILPKGWPIKDRSLPASAAQEALEEAGCLGQIAMAPCGSFKYQKATAKGYDIESTVEVYPLKVSYQCLDWRERRERNLEWVSLGQAASLVDEMELRHLLQYLNHRPERILNASYQSLR